MITIRRSNDNDIPQLEKLFLITRQQTFVEENPNKFTLEDFKKTTVGELIFVAEDQDGKILGFISIWEEDKFIHHLFVTPGHQRKGIGGLLIRSLLPWLPLPYRLKCIAKNKEALAFYQKTGWIEVERGIGEDGEYFLLELAEAPKKEDDQ
ncbi:MAG: GNAT family N-acetyltransferase [Chlamydiales bacterium]|nr:GNAT family N-acetyltransferase [Chlamydiales bacterium]